MDGPQVINRLQDLPLSGRERYTPNRYTVPLRDGVDINDLVRGDGTMFETDLQRMADFEEEESQYFDREEVFQQLNYECNDFGDESGSDKDDDVTPFKRMARGMEDLSEDGGVSKKVLRPGTGPVVPTGATVRYHVNGYVEFNDEPFDSSRLRGRPEVHKIDEILPGLSIGIMTMRKGEKSRFLLSPQYAFKQRGCPPRIPPAATVLYEVELLSYIDRKAADDYEGMSEEEKKEASFEKLLKVANSEREAGNDFYKRKQVSRALSNYLKAIKILENYNLQNADEERSMNEVLVKVYLNAAQCSLELGQQGRVISYSRKALGIDPKNTKAFYKIGKAYMRESEFTRARDWFRKAQNYEPNNKEIKDALVELDRKVKQFKTIEKQMCTRMFAQANIAKKDESEDDIPALQTVQLSEEKKEVLVKRLREFKEDSSAKEISFPATLTQKEVDCIKQLARSLDLRVESKVGKGANRELKVIKENPAL